MPSLFKRQRRAHAAQVCVLRSLLKGVTALCTAIRAAMSVKLFYHCCAINHCSDVVSEYIKLVNYTCLYDIVASINVFLCGSPEGIAQVRALFGSAGAKYHIRVEAPGDTSYERLTLTRIAEYIAPDDLVLYTHSKSVTRLDRRANVQDWMDFMHFHLIRDWRVCVEILRDGRCDTVGVNFEEAPKPHFSGNFWWVRGDYFLTLPKEIGPDYWAPELEFLFLNNPRYVCLAHSKVNHYLVPFPFKQYIDTPLQTEYKIHKK